MATIDVALKIQDKLEALHYHEMVTPEGGGEPTEGPAIMYFDHVWIGMPKKIPMKSVNFVAIEIAGEPSWTINTCAAKGTKEVDIQLTVYTKGKTETATAEIYRLADVVVDMVLANPKWDATCMGSDMVDIIYGELAEPEGKKIIAGAQINFKVYMMV